MFPQCIYVCVCVCVCVCFVILTTDIISLKSIQHFVFKKEYTKFCVQYQINF